MSIGFESVTLEECTRSHQGSSAGPTVLEVFNTLLKHLRFSVELEANDLQAGSTGKANVDTSSKDSDEKMVQNAVIQTIGEDASLFRVLWKTLIQKALIERTGLSRCVS